MIRTIMLALLVHDRQDRRTLGHGRQNSTDVSGIGLPCHQLTPIQAVLPSTTVDSMMTTKRA